MEQLEQLERLERLEKRGGTGGLANVTWGCTGTTPRVGINGIESF